jgi:AcrR family transcriptional regulator
MSNEPQRQRPAVLLKRRRGRRPAVEVRQAVLTAAAELLFDAGLAGVTFDRVAARSGASKTTIYKWWPSPGALAFEAYFTAVETTLAFPDTGDIAADLRSQLKAFVALVTDKRSGVITELIGAAQSDRDLARALLDAYVRPRREFAVERMRKAQALGQIRSDVDLEICVDQLWGACYHRLLLPALPLDEAFTDALVANLVTGIAGGRSTNRPRRSKAQSSSRGAEPSKEGT